MTSFNVKFLFFLYVAALQESVNFQLVPITSGKRKPGRPKGSKRKAHCTPEFQNPSTKHIQMARGRLGKKFTPTAGGRSENSQQLLSIETSRPNEGNQIFTFSTAAGGQIDMNEPKTHRDGHGKTEVVVGGPVVSSPQWLRSKQQLDNKLKSSAPLLKHSKEEKFSLDLQVTHKCSIWPTCQIL